MTVTQRRNLPQGLHKLSQTRLAPSCVPDPGVQGRVV